MSGSTATPVAPGPLAPTAPPSPAETVIDQRLRQARRHVRGVDLAAGLLRLTVGVLAYLLVFAVLDHWLVTGGLGYFGRFLASLVLLAGVGVYLARVVVPAVVYRIHPLFAAQALERGRPGVKNSLINFLLLRDHRQELQPVVYDTVQRRAAADVAGIEVEAAVDRTHVFRLGYVLAGTLALCCLYFVLSPKSLVTSAARVLWPFSRIPAPTRVTLGEIEPGNATAYLGNTITVTAVARGLRDDEPVTLYFSTADGQLVNQAVPMTLPDRDFRHRAELPPGGRGFQQDGVYFLAAGDFRSEPFRVNVETAPSIVVDRVVLEYPGYTGLAPRTLRRQGDLQALEGTRATVYAEANHPIRRAEIDLGSNGKHGIGMKADDRTAVGAFTLRLDPNDPTRPQHDNYQLRFVDAAGRVNPRPIRHRIEVIRDLPPEVVLLEPKQQQTEVPADGQVTIRVRAEDPDFALRQVGLRAVSSGRDLKLRPLLSESGGGPGFRGPFTGEFEFRPRQFELKPGDRVLYWAEAEDIRQPAANRTETNRRWLEIVDPIGRPEPDRREPTPADPRRDPARPGEPAEQQPPTEKPPQQPGQPEQELEQDVTEQQPGLDETARPEQPQPDGQDQAESDDGGQADPSGQGEGTPGGKPEAGEGAAGGEDTAKDSAPIDPDTNPGDAIERILEHRRQQQGDQPEPGEPQQPGEQTDQQQQQPGDPAQQQPGQKPPPKDQPGDQPSEPSEGQPADEQPDGSKPGDGQQKGDGARPGEQPGDQQQPSSGDQPAGQPGDQQEPGQPGSEQESTPGQKPPGAQPDGPADPEGGPADDSGDQPPGQMQPSPDPGDSGAQQQPGTPGAQPQPGAGKPSDGAPEPGSAERSGGETAPSPERTEQEPGGEPQDGGIQGDDQMQEQSPGAGTPSEQPSGSPSPQEDNIDRPKKPGQVEGEASQREEQSPSISPKQSDTEGDTAGDRSGGGEEGGGQRADQPGVGSPGAQTDAESGAGASPQQGDGLPGSRAGDQVEADGPTGSSARRPDGSGGQQRGEPGGQKPGEGPQQPSDGSMPPGQTMQQPPDGGQPGEQVSEGPGAHGSSSPTQGGAPDPRTAGTTDRPAGEPGAEAANLDFARKQTQLALDYLKNESNKPNSDLLDQLGWSEAEARRFIDQWEQLRQRAGRDDAEGRQASQSLDQALRSLGLRPHGTELKRGATPAQRIDGIREAGRFRPPADWAEQFEAYTRSIAEGER